MGCAFAQGRNDADSRRAPRHDRSLGSVDPDYRERPGRMQRPQTARTASIRGVSASRPHRRAGPCAKGDVEARSTICRLPTAYRLAAAMPADLAYGRDDTPGVLRGYDQTNTSSVSGSYPHALRENDRSPRPHRRHACHPEERRPPAGHSMESTRDPGPTRVAGRAMLRHAPRSVGCRQLTGWLRRCLLISRAFRMTARGVLRGYDQTNTSSVSGSYPHALRENDRSPRPHRRHACHPAERRPRAGHSMEPTRDPGPTRVAAGRC